MIKRKMFRNVIFAFKRRQNGQVLSNDKTKKPLLHIVEIRSNGTEMEVNESVEGESIETKLFRMIKNKEPLNAGASIQFDEKKDGVDPACDIRTDTNDLALDAITMKQKIEANKLSKKLELGKNPDSNKEAKDQSIQGTSTESAA